MDNVDGMLAISERETVPLERESRKAMMRSDRELRELDEGDDEEKEEVISRRRNQRKKDDVVLDESFRILVDLIDLAEGRELPVRGGLW